MTFVVGMESRSNFNIGGSINVENETLIENKPINLDFDQRLYKTLWSVINICHNPQRLTMDGHMKWHDFKSNIEVILKAFEQAPISFHEALVNSRDSLQSFIYPKYITSIHMFHYQLRDSSFRRQVLIQIAISIISHFHLNKIKPSRKILHQIAETDRKWIMTSIKNIILLLEKVPFFERGIYDPMQSRNLALNYKEFLFREFHFIFWKHDRSTKQKGYNKKETCFIKKETI